MKALSTWSAGTDSHFHQRSVIAFDLDDTLTERGALPAEVVAELERAQARGWVTVLVTGRSAGWVDAIIKLLPFDGVVGENGAVLNFWAKGKRSRKDFEVPRKLFWTPAGFGEAPPERLGQPFAAVQSELQEKFPRARVASDQRFRIYDLAIDFAEEVDPPLSLADAQGIWKIFCAHGATAKVSSIHVNGWWGDFSKDAGLRQLVEGQFGASLRRNLIYVGDSPNDDPLFQCGALSVGVANVRRFVGSPNFKGPEFVARAESARGSIEVLRYLGPVLHGLL